MIVLPSEFALPDNPLIGWHSLVSASNVSADQQASTAPVTQLADPSTYNPWTGTSNAAQSVQMSLSSAQPVDYVGIANHNFGTAGVTYFIEYSANGADWTEAASDTPQDDSVIFHVFESVTAQYWRVRLTAGTLVPQAAVLYIGEVLQVTRRVYVGHTPITLGRSTNTRPGRSESGQYLGRVVSRRMYQARLEFNNLDPDWYRTYFDPFAIAAEEYPFFWGWRPTTYSDEVAYAWAMSDVVPDNHRPNGMMRVSFPIQALTGTLPVVNTFQSS